MNLLRNRRKGGPVEQMEPLSGRGGTSEFYFSLKNVPARIMEKCLPVKGKL